MTLAMWRFAIDCSLFVLIWMVQLLIYPSFRHFTPAGLGVWHRKYTRNMTFIVAPLMILQLFVAGYLVFLSGFKSMLDLVYMLFIVGCWIITFIKFIPLHQHIDREPENEQLSIKLTDLNWVRVVLWSTIVAIDVVVYCF